MAKNKEIIKQKRLPVARRLRVLLMTIVLFLTPTLIYFTYYISDQTNNFNDQNFRHLASISDQIEQRIEGLKMAFRNAIKNALKRNPAGASLGKGEFQQGLDAASEQPVGTKFEAVDGTTLKPEYAGPEQVEREFASANVWIRLMSVAGTLRLLFICEVDSGAQHFTFRAWTRLKDLIKISSQNRTEWIWPSKELSGVYRQTFLINLILCFIGMVVVGRTDGTPAIILISLIAFTGILYLCLSLRLRPPFKRLDRVVQFLRINKLFSRRNDYVWNMVLLLILTGILPAAAFFKVAYNQEMKLFVKQGQIRIAKDMAERKARVKSQYAPERADAPNLQLWKKRDEAEKFINRRLDDKLDVYDAACAAPNYFRRSAALLIPDPKEFLQFVAHARHSLDHEHPRFLQAARYLSGRWRGLKSLSLNQTLMHTARDVQPSSSAAASEGSTNATRFLRDRYQ